MSNVMPIRVKPDFEYALVKKYVDGQLIICVDLDALTPSDKLRYFSKAAEKKTSADVVGLFTQPGL